MRVNYSPMACGWCAELFIPRGWIDPCCSLECRLAYYTEQRGSDECWPWRGALQRKGYAILRDDGKAKRVHRILYEIKLGWLPPDILVRHTCDNRWCVNPAHVIAGSPYSNSRDMVNRGRSRNQFTARLLGYVSYERLDPITRENL